MCCQSRFISNYNTPSSLVEKEGRIDCLVQCTAHLLRNMLVLIVNLVSMTSQSMCFRRGYYCCDRTPWLKTTWGRKGLFHSSFHITVHQKQGGQELKAGWNLEAGADAEAMKCCLLACSPWLVQLSFLQTQNHQPRDASNHNGLATLPFPTAESYGGWHFLNWSVFLSGNSSLCQVDIKLYSTRFYIFLHKTCRHRSIVCECNKDSNLRLC